FRMMEHHSMEEFKKLYDYVLVVFSMKGYAQTNNVRVTYSVGHSSEIPWSVHEIPTIGVSLCYTNHLYDAPMLKTFVNAYAPTKEYIRALVEKLTGKSPFKGQANDLVWCGRWETRL
ncbi:MAG: glycosyl hydrolase, partial [Lachnospiraceae bacterium]|nr:glycosyl hydrolase [Lachnospiraceae bacterium]